MGQLLAGGIFNVSMNQKVIAYSSDVFIMQDEVTYLNALLSINYRLSQFYFSFMNVIYSADVLHVQV